MSSIDKGVENLVSGMGKNIRVSKQGNMIVGYINGERVFSIADRYGYLKDDEKNSIIKQINQYERKKRQAEESRRRAEEMRREAERQRQEARNAEMRRQAAEMAARAEQEKAAAERAALEAEQARRRAIEEQARIAREREEERIRREAAIQAAKEEAERRERARLEAERQAANREVQGAVRSKQKELEDLLSEYAMQQQIASQNEQKRVAKLQALSQKSGGMDLSSLVKQHTQEAEKQKEILSGEIEIVRKRLQEVKQVQAMITSDQTTEQYQELKKRCNSISVPSSSESSVEYSHNSMMTEYVQVEEKLDSLVRVRGELEKFCGENGAVGRLAEGALERIRKTAFRSRDDVDELIRNCAEKLTDIGNEKNMQEVVALGQRLSLISGQTDARQTTGRASVNATYRAKDYRSEIVRKARAVYNGYEQLRKEAYSSCSEQNNQAIRNRLNEILKGSAHEEEVLREIEVLESQLAGIRQTDRLHQDDYYEYQELVRRLKEFGVPDDEIHTFRLDQWKNIRAEMIYRLETEQREYEKSQLLMTDASAKQVMESMGYEVLSTVGDNGLFVRETLYTKKGYPGVLWQIISYSNGSIYRRMIGVNTGETQTDINYVKEVAAELEAENEPQEFLNRWIAISGNRVVLTDDVDHDSDNTNEAIEKNGYYYLKNKSLETVYNNKMTEYETMERVEEASPQQSTQSPKTKKAKKKHSSSQVPLSHGRIIRDSNLCLREEQQRCMKMTGYAH